MTEQPGGEEGANIWLRLRRRKVVQWGLAYAAGAWGLLQGLSYVVATFHWPERIQQLATVGLLIGLPIALVLAWYHGDRGEQRVTRTELAILTLLFLLGGGLFWRYQHSVEPANAERSAGPAQSPASPGATSSDTRPSIAVLPFENRSAKQDDAFFVDGVHDDILTQLSKVSALKVISRTSVERFRKTELPLREIAQQLGVRSILEGGVQRAGDRVRINVQLIDAATDAHLWAENYDRELTAANIFAVQSEVAEAIAEALKATLTPAERERLRAVPTQNLQAWEAYQLGAQYLSKRTSASLAEAETFFRRAIDRDPDFALAYVGLADATWLQADYGGRPWEPAVAKAEEFLGTALRLNPNLAEARVTLAKFAQERRDFNRARLLYDEALALNPNYPIAHYWYAQLLALEGRDDDAERSLQKAIELDPMSTLFQAANGWDLSALGKFDAALQAFDKVRSIDPGNPRGYEGIGAVLATGFGRLNEAVPYFERAIQLDPDAYEPTASLGQAYLDLEDGARVGRLLESATANKAAQSLIHAYQQLYAGRPAAALAGAEQVLAIDRRNALALRLLRDADLQNHDARRARARYEQSFPELLQAGSPDVDFLNLSAAVDLALVLQSTGEGEQAAQLLDRSDSRIAKAVRMGPWGFGILDAQVLAMRGRQREALAAMRSAEKSGWRGPLWRYYRDFDPSLASIRNEAEFKAVFADIERDVARQRTALANRAKDAPLDPRSSPR